MPRVSIIIPCYNYANFIIDCVASCVSQDFKDIEIIVVDDCSADNSATAAVSSGDNRIRVLSTEKNRGYSAAKNIGIRNSSGELLVFIDADDMLTPGSISRRLEVFDKHPEAQVVHGHALKIHGDVDYTSCVKEMKTFERHKSRLHAQGFMIRRSVFEKFGLFYEPLRSKSDKEYWYRIGIHDKSPIKKKVNVRRCHYDVAFYRRHDKAMHKMRLINKKYNSEVETLFEKRIKQLKKEGITRENTIHL